MFWRLRYTIPYITIPCKFEQCKTPYNTKNQVSDLHANKHHAHSKQSIPCSPPAPPPISLHYISFWSWRQWSKFQDLGHAEKSIQKANRSPSLQTDCGFGGKTLFFFHRTDQKEKKSFVVIFVRILIDNDRFGLFALLFISKPPRWPFKNVTINKTPGILRMLLLWARLHSEPAASTNHPV